MGGGAYEGKVGGNDAAVKGQGKAGQIRQVLAGW